jgi:hypothetical protein
MKLYIIFTSFTICPFKMNIKICNCCLNHYTDNSRNWCKKIRTSIRVFRYHVNMLNSDTIDGFARFQSPIIIDNIINVLYSYIGKPDAKRQIDELSSPFSFWACRQCHDDMMSKNYSIWLELTREAREIDAELPKSNCLRVINNNRLPQSLQQLCTSIVDSHIVVQLLLNRNMDISKLFIQ